MGELNLSGLVFPLEEVGAADFWAETRGASSKRAIILGAMVTEFFWLRGNSDRSPAPIEDRF